MVAVSTHSPEMEAALVVAVAVAMTRQGNNNSYAVMGTGGSGLVVIQYAILV